MRESKNRPVPALPRHGARSSPPGPHTAPLRPQPGRSRRDPSATGLAATPRPDPDSASPLAPRLHLPLLYCRHDTPPTSGSSSTPTSGFFSLRLTPLSNEPAPHHCACALVASWPSAALSILGVVVHPAAPAPTPQRRENYVSQSAARGTAPAAGADGKR